MVSVLTHKCLEMHGCIISSVATDVLVLRHQGISSYSAGSLLIVVKDFYNKSILQQKTLQNKITFFEKKNYLFVKGLNFK